MLDVLIGILISSAFLAVSMQALVIATVFRVNAQKKQIASQLIQQDVEAVKFAANQFQQNTNESFNVDSKCSAATYNNGYAKAIFDNLPSVSGNRKLLGSTGTEFALERINKSAGGTAPYKVLRIKYRVSEWANGNFVYTTETDREKNSIAKDYIEVIPNAALLCP